MKLDAGQKNLLGLIIKEADVGGWASVSSSVFPLVVKIPHELVETEAIGKKGRGRVRLTDEGKNLMAAMEWL